MDRSPLKFSKSPAPDRSASEDRLLDKFVMAPEQLERRLRGDYKIARAVKALKDVGETLENSLSRRLIIKTRADHETLQENAYF